MFKNKVQNGAIPLSHEPIIDLFHQLEARFTQCRPSLRTVHNWPGWKLEMAKRWLTHKTDRARPSFLRRYR